MLTIDKLEDIDVKQIRTSTIIQIISINSSMYTLQTLYTNIHLALCVCVCGLCMCVHRYFGKDCFL